MALKQRKRPLGVDLGIDVVRRSSPLSACRFNRSTQHTWVLPRFHGTGVEPTGAITLIQRFGSMLNQKMGSFDAEFLPDFFTDEIGPYFDNPGLYDARAVLLERLETKDGAIYAIEKPRGQSSQGPI